MVLFYLRDSVKVLVLPESLIFLSHCDFRFNAAETVQAVRRYGPGYENVRHVHRPDLLFAQLGALQCASLQG